jgi:hypothetical protein
MLLKILDTRTGEYFKWGKYSCGVNQHLYMSEVETLTVENCFLGVLLVNGFSKTFDLNVYSFSVGW